MTSAGSTYLAIVRWEVRTGLRRISTWAYIALFFFLGFTIMAAAAGVWPEVNFALGSGGKVYANAPYALMVLINIVALFGVPVTAALAGNALHRDFESGAYPLFYTTPVSRLTFLGGRFTGALVVNAIVLAAIGMGAFLALQAPSADANRIGVSHLMGFVQPYLVLVLPNLVFTAALLFALVSLTRQMLPNYVGGVVLLIGYLIASSLATDFPNRHLAALIDPFGIQALDAATRYWSVAEKNSRLVTLTGDLLFNRLIWVGVGLGVLTLAVKRFRFTHALPAASASSPSLAVELAVDVAAAVESGRGAPAGIRAVPRVVTHPSFGTRAYVAQFSAIFRRSLLGILFSRYFAVIVGAGLLFLVIAGQQAGKLYGTTTYPVTYEVEELLSGTFGIFMLVLIAFYAGELIWAERDARISQIQDAAPVPTGVALLAKLGALATVITVLVSVTMLCGIVTQAIKGYYRFEIPLYLESVFGIRLVDYLLLAVLAMAIHVIVNQKYIGHLVVLLVYIGIGLLPVFGIEHNLFAYGADGGSTYSDMNGFGPYIRPFIFWKLYWGAFAVLLVVVAQLLWVRGELAGSARRLTIAGRRFRGAVRIAAFAALAAFVGLGGFIYYNTNLLNHYVTSKQERRLRAEYERLYKRFEFAPQPRIASVRVRVELYPSKGNSAVDGHYVLRNRTTVPIDTVHLRTPSSLRVHEVAFDRESERVLADSAHEYYMYRLGRPLAPGDSVDLHFVLSHDARGFENDIGAPAVAKNGTFATQNDLAPGIGYAAAAELTGEKDRQREGLPVRVGVRPPTDTIARRNSYVSSDADWIDFEATIGTDYGQTAIAPGEFMGQWAENGRSYFRYKMDYPMLPLWAVLSARYVVKHSTWHDIGIDVYYHPAHAYNVDRMIESVQQSLEYYHEHFGPYPHSAIRIVEFPRYAAYAQSLPGMIPYSEAIGFIARVEKPTDIDYPFYVTAHEVAHQWWANQVVGGDVAGATMLSETLAQYSALMVMEQSFGPANMKRFLEYELDRYLAGRSAGGKEEPLALVENQPHIHYNKGALVMYALRDALGDYGVSFALEDFGRLRQYQQPPYTTSLELLSVFRRVADTSQYRVIEDLFERITLFELHADSSTASKLSDGRWLVNLYVTAKKLYADSLGAETEVPMDDLIDIAVYPPGGSPTKGTVPLYIAKERVVSGPQVFQVTGHELPGSAGIDPLNKMIDRDPADNVVVVRSVPSTPGTVAGVPPGTPTRVTGGGVP